MRRLFLLLCAVSPTPPPDLPLIDRLNEHIQLRFHNSQPDALGMSGNAVPRSMGRHFRPRVNSPTDFVPRNTAERETVARLEERDVQVGIYVVGTAILKSPPSLLDFRALKGPAAVTRGTPRPAWYPRAPKAAAFPDPLPDWNEIYPMARRAMSAFHEGGPSFDTTFGTWNIAARPVAGERRCSSCHVPGTSIGGVLYVFRRSGP
jgi:hypothetical protein